MTRIDLTPLYRNSVGFDRLGSLLDNAVRADKPAYPPYDIEIRSENAYAITLAVAGFDESEIDIQVENGLLSIRGKKADETEERSYLYRGIANRSFERKFNLADYIEVSGAELNNGLLTVNLLKEIPEAMKPRSIEIKSSSKPIEYQTAENKAA
jgi:molecular chaperone IbpA